MTKPRRHDPGPNATARDHDYRPEHEYLVGRLVNWQFTTAAEHMNQREGLGLPEETQNAISTLALLYGNPGWFEGAMADMIMIVVDSLLRDLRELHIVSPEQQ